MKTLTTIAMVNGTNVIAGQDGCKSIEMRNDGNGLTGHYDVVYIEFDAEITDEISAIPAHNLLSWSFKKGA